MTHSSASDTWPQRLALDLGRNIQKARQTATEPLTAQELSDRCGALGHPLSRSRIASIETGRKLAAVVDVLVISAALGVPPMWLLAPSGTRWAEPVEVLPDLRLAPDIAYDALSGRTPLSVPAVEDPDLTAVLRAESLRRRNGAWLTSEHNRWTRLWQRHVEAGEDAPDLARLSVIRRSMRVSGVPVPALPEGVPDDPASDLDHHDDDLTTEA